MDLTTTNIVLLTAAGFMAGAVNGVAGGGSLLSFPALMLAGAPALTANVTNQVAQCFGYVGGVSGYRRELAGQGQRLRRLGVDVAVGSLAGVILLRISSPQTFESVVPWLLFVACGLLFIQPRVAAAIRRHSELPERRRSTRRGPGVLDISHIVAGAYGAYFGGGLGVMILAMLGILVVDHLQRLNALKAVLSLIVGVLAAICFAFTAPVEWSGVALVGPTSLIGGTLGAGLAQRLRPETLRVSVAVLGALVGVKLLIG